MHPSEQFYQERINQFAGNLMALERKSKKISLTRLAVFVISIVCVYYFAQNDGAVGIAVSVLTGIILFLVLVRIHSVTLEEKKLQEALLAVNSNEKSAFRGYYGGFYDGAAYNSPDHPYCHDIDLFGPGSLYQFLNRTASYSGREALARMLKEPYLEKEEIIKMQDAVKEMAPMLEWRHLFQAIGIAYKEGPGDRQKIEDWSLSKPLFGNRIFQALVVVVPLLTASMIALLSTGIINVQAFLVYLTIPWGISGSYARRVNNRHNKVSRTTEMLQKYAALLQEIEQLDSSSEKIKDLQQKLGNGRVTAGRSIKSLSSILTALDNRLNFMSWALLNGLVLWDILQMIRLERWQKKHKAKVKHWFDVVAECDVINGFANYLFNHPGTVFPEIGSGEFEIMARDAGHPLIQSDRRINNDIKIKQGEFLIVTGANMAGKSTYLRTIAVNLILAMCGAPVCASRFRFVPVQVFTSIRTNDSLKENESYFYAELKRLKVIIDRLRDGENLFIILDEILKGTNSRDKHAGSEALLKQLISFHATGVVATHDVLLGKLSETFPDNIRNHCFEVDIEGDRLQFDYRLRDGVSRNLNATLLMREMGITI